MVETKTTVNYGMVGCGMMGQEHLRNLALIEGAQVSAIFEPDAGMREKSRALAPQARFVDSLEALLAHSPLDALVITSPNHLHAEQLLQISAVGARGRALPVLMEKPACTSLADVARLRPLAKAYPAPPWNTATCRRLPPSSSR
jgi:myo-inositol 2-dehydrogenase / D-chiro-inositol 1-dehydrogenase